MEIKKFDAIQSFYVDADAVNSASEIYLTSIELYFKKKPSLDNKTASIYKPGVTVSICDIENELPLLKKVKDESLTRVEYDRIYQFSDASVSTSFIFKSPILLKTNRFYGIVVQYDEVGFELWSNKQGDRIVGTNTPSPGINSAKDGKFYNGASNPTSLQALTNIDLKYKVNIAKFTANTMTVELVNKDYEFLTVNSISGTFVGGEYVFKRAANSAGNVAVTLGNVTITGTGTDFSTLHSGDKITIWGPGTSNGTVLTVAAVNSNTSLDVKTTPLFSNTSTKYIADVVGKVYKYDSVNKQLYLYESTANTAKYLANGDVVVGMFSKASATVQTVDNFTVDRVVPDINITSPLAGSYSGTYNFSYSNGVAYVVDSSKERTLATGAINEVNKYGAFVLSRSNEVNDSYLYDTNARKSAITKLTFKVNASTDRLFTAPSINEDDIDFYVQQSNVSSDCTVTVDGVVYDTEVGKNGTAVSKHFSKKVTFANNMFAEDVRVFANIYRPGNTDVKIYCKLHNITDPEAFDDKSWTPLEIIDNAGKYSSSENRDDYIEYTYALPRYPETANTLPGTFEINTGNTVIIGSGVTVNSYVTTGDVVRVYNPLQANSDYFVAGVASANSTTMTLNLSTANSSVLGSGFKVDKVKYKNVAFNNPQNDNMSAYFNQSLSEVDKFNTIQFKIVFLANATHFVPRVNSISVVGVSA